MTKETLAAQLNGREMGDEIKDAEEKAAKNARLLIIFGTSDNLCELRGAVNDEADSEAIYVSRDGRLLPEIDDDDARVLKSYDVLSVVEARRGDAIKIKTLWCAEKDGPSWTYKTKEPHATFNVMEDGEVYYRGIVIQL